MKIFLCIILFLFSMKSYSMDIELEGSYSYDQYYYGSNNENETYNNLFLGSLAFIPFSLTALQFDYIYGQTILLEDQDYLATEDTEVVYSKRDIETQTFSINLRQAFTGSNSFIRPMISLGWARRFTFNSGYVDTRDNTGEVTRTNQPQQELKQDLTQLALYLKIRIFNGFYLSLSGRTLFEGFEIAEANQNLRLFIGFSWIL